MSHFFNRANQAGDIYVHGITSVYNTHRVYDPDFGLLNDPEFYDKVMRDAVVGALCNQRKHLIAGRRWKMEPATDNQVDIDAAGLIEEIIDAMPMFAEARFNLGEAFLKGRTFGFMAGEKKIKRFFDGKPRMYWMPGAIQDVDKRRFRLITDRPEQSDLQTHWEFWSISRGRWEVLENPEWFIKHTYTNKEQRLGWGLPLAEALYYYLYAKTQALKDGLQGLARWAQGVVTAKVENLRDGSTGKTNQAVVDKWLDELEKMRSRHVMAYDKADEIEVLNGPGQGHQIVVNFITYLDNSMARLILGSVMPSGGDAGQGSFARAQIEENTTEALIQFDREILSETITRDLISLIWNLNRPALESLGLLTARLPRFKIIQEKRDDPEKAVKVIGEALRSGIKLREDEVYEKIGFTPVSDDDKFIDPAEAQPKPAGGLPGLDSLPFAQLPEHTYADCKPGETSAKTGCTPKKGEGGGGKIKDRTEAKRLLDDRDKINQEIDSFKRQFEMAKKDGDTEAMKRIKKNMERPLGELEANTRSLKKIAALDKVKEAAAAVRPKGQTEPKAKPAGKKEKKKKAKPKPEAKSKSETPTPKPEPEKKEPATDTASIVKEAVEEAVTQIGTNLEKLLRELLGK